MSLPMIKHSPTGGQQAQAEVDRHQNAQRKCGHSHGCCNRQKNRCENQNGDICFHQHTYKRQQEINDQQNHDAVIRNAQNRCCDSISTLARCQDPWKSWNSHISKENLTYIVQNFVDANFAQNHAEKHA